MTMTVALAALACASTPADEDEDFAEIPSAEQLYQDGVAKLEDGGKVLWIFESPHELQGTGFLAWQNQGKPDTLWVYFPGQRRVRRVPPSFGVTADLC